MLSVTRGEIRAQMWSNGIGLVGVKRIRVSERSFSK